MRIIMTFECKGCDVGKELSHVLKEIAGKVSGGGLAAVEGFAEGKS